MLWIPGLSLVIFFLFIIPFMFYGYKKGWVYALSFSVVLWLLTLIFISINYLLYEDYLWDFFYEIFLKKNLKVDIDFKNLSKFYKTQAILFVTGIEFILIYPMTFLIMFFINNFIKKYFGHKYAAISKSQKEIVYRRNISTSKLTGAAILTVSTLFSASLFTSFTNVMLIPQQKRNFASNINDTMGRIYSLGLTNNPESAQIISEFISDKLDNKLSASIQELMNFKSDETTAPNIFPNMEKINYFESKQKDFNNLYKNEASTRGVFSSVIRNQKKLNPLTFDANTSILTKDVNENTIGYNKSEIGNLSFFNSAINQVSLLLPKSLLNFLVERFSNSFVNFKDTIFYKNFINAIENEKQQGKLKKDRQKDLDNYKIKLQGLKAERKNLIKTLEMISGTSYPGNDADFDLNSGLNFPQKAISYDNPGTGSFKKERDEAVRLRDLFDNKNDVLSNIENDYLSYKTNTYDPAQETIRRLEISYKSLNDEVENLKKSTGDLTNLLTNLKKRLSNLEVKKRQLENKINNLTTNRTAISTRIDNLNQEIRLSTSETEKQNKRKEIQTLETQSRSYIQQINEQRTNLIETNSVISSIKNDIAENENTINTYQSSITSKEREKTNTQISLNAENSKFKKIEIEELKRKNARDAALKEVSQAKSVYDFQNEKVENLIRDYLEKIQTLESSNDDIIDHKDQIDTLENRDEANRFVAPAVLWNKRDDGSIFYNQEYQKWWTNKKEQLQIINNEKESIFNNKKAEMIQLYAQWLGNKDEK